MKNILSKTQPIGSDGAQASESLGLDGGDLVLDLQVRYPVAKLMKPVTDGLEKAKAAIESAIPGEWDKAILDPIFKGLEDEIIKQLSE